MFLVEIWWTPKTKTPPKTHYVLGGDLVDAKYPLKSPLYFLVDFNGFRYSGNGT